MEAYTVVVKPRAREARIEKSTDGAWLVRVKASPVDGKANAEVLALVAKHFGVPRSRVTLKSGFKSRTKRILVDR